MDGSQTLRMTGHHGWQCTVRKAADQLRTGLYRPTTASLRHRHLAAALPAHITRANMRAVTAQPGTGLHPVVKFRACSLKVARVAVPGGTTRSVFCHAASAPAAELQAPATAATTATESPPPAAAVAAEAPASVEQQPEPAAASSSSTVLDVTSTPEPSANAAAPAAAVDNSSSRRRTDAPKLILVSKSNQPEKLADTILLKLRDTPDAPVVLSSQGVEGCAVAHKAIVLARALMRDSNPEQQLQYQPQRNTRKPLTDAQDGSLQVTYRYYITVRSELAADTTTSSSSTSSSSSSSSSSSDNPVIKIGSKTRPEAAAAAIAGRMKQHGSATLAAVGPTAIYATQQALSTGRLDCIDQHGFDFQVVPALTLPEAGQEGVPGVVATFTLVKCSPRPTLRRRPGSFNRERRPSASAAAAAAADAAPTPGEVRLSAEEYADMKAQLAALPGLTQQLALMTEQHKQLLALLAQQQQEKK